MTQVFLKLTKLFFLITIGIFLIPKPALAKSDNKTKPKLNYRRDQIRESRFGNKEKQELLQKIYKLDQEINKNIFGQEIATEALRSRLAQYIEGFGNREKEPIAMNLIGLPGIGKSAIVDELNKLGIQTIHIDAQSYALGSNTDFSYELINAYENLDLKKPVIIIVEELDKVPEVNEGKEMTQKLIGALNEILSEGKLSSHGSRKNFANAMILTTMNLSPLEISKFSKEALGKKKSFYDFNVKDLSRFHEWITNQSSALPKILSNIFRSNTVSRLSPNTILLKPLSAEDYVKVTQKTINQVIEKMTDGRSKENRLQVTYTNEFLKFITEKSTYAPSGSRNTIAKSDALTEQLIHFAKRATIPRDDSLNRPRKMTLSYDKKTQKAIIEITPQVLVKGKVMKDKTPFFISVSFSESTSTFLPPNEIALVPPPVISENSNEEKPLTKTQIRERRFPKTINLTKDLESKLNQQIFGQEIYTKILSQEMNNYLARSGAAENSPAGIVFAGFPGIGKSEIFNLTGKYLTLPIVRINLQQFSSNDNESANAFISTIVDQVQKLKGKKYILLLEELDKVFEIDPQKGNIVNRPVMALIKDLLNNGQVKYSFMRNGYSSEISVDVRDAFVGVTMNFAVNRFHFEADPRLTTIGDVIGAWKRLNTSLADLKALMGSMFLPETVNRLLARINILKPLEEKDYKALIEKQINAVIKSRFFDNDGRDIGQITLQITPRYKQFLYDESVIPSEGARHALTTTANLLNDDIELLTKKIPKTPKFSGEKLIYTLDYDSESQTVKGSIVVKDNPRHIAKDIYKRPVVLSFPPLQAVGKMSKERLLTGVHEFGHALVSVRLGRRFEYTTSVSPKAGVGGYVKYTSDDQSALSLINSIYTALASRAMERIILNRDARNDYSVLSITSGASNDIMQATNNLFDAIYQYGFDPKGGTIERLGIPYANFSSLTSEEVKQLGVVLREMENKIVEDLLNAHSQEWYTEKAKVFTRAGGMYEKEFYALIEYAYPGKENKSPSEISRLHEVFNGDIQEESSDLIQAREARNSNDNMTIPERAESFKKFFSESIARNIHKDTNLNRTQNLNLCSNLFAAH